MGQYENIAVAQSADVMTRSTDRQQKRCLIRYERWVPTFFKGVGRSSYIRVTNISDKPQIVHEDMTLGMWLSEGKVPRQMGYISVGSQRYIEWQNLVYQATTDLISNEDLVDEDTLPLVENPEYLTPTKLLIRESSVKTTGEVCVENVPQILNVTRTRSLITTDPTEENNDDPAKKDPNPNEISKNLRFTLAWLLSSTGIDGRLGR